MAKSYNFSLEDVMIESLKGTIKYRKRGGFPFWNVCIRAKRCSQSKCFFEMYVQGQKGDSVCFNFFFGKKNKFKINPKINYDTISHVNEVNSGPLKLSLFKYIVLWKI
jgi:hypothetical protein